MSQANQSRKLAETEASVIATEIKVPIELTDLLTVSDSAITNMPTLDYVFAEKLNDTAISYSVLL